MAASDARPEKKAAFPSAPLLIPVNLFSKFQVDSPWRIMTTVDFRRAPERRARWVARSNMMELLCELLLSRALRAAGAGSVVTELGMQRSRGSTTDEQAGMLQSRRKIDGKANH